jgi:ankyrin repeat protein
MASSPEIVQCLIDHGARLIARLVDGKTALHIAAARGNVTMVKALMDKSLENEAEEDEKIEARREAKRIERKLQGLNIDDELPEDHHTDDSSSETSEFTLESEESDSMTMGSFVKIPVEEVNVSAGFGSIRCIYLTYNLGWCTGRFYGRP